MVVERTMPNMAHVALSTAGFGVQALAQGEGALGSLAKFANTFSPELAEKIDPNF